jgi:hypothetical protein
MEDAPIRFLKQLSWEAPILAVCLAGLVASLAYRGRHPGRWLLAASAMGLFLATSVGSALLGAYFTYKRLGWAMPAIAMSGTLLHAAAFGLLLLAVFRPDPVRVGHLRRVHDGRGVLFGSNFGSKSRWAMGPSPTAPRTTRTGRRRSWKS